MYRPQYNVNLYIYKLVISCQWVCDNHLNIIQEAYGYTPDFSPSAGCSCLGESWSRSSISPSQISPDEFSPLCLESKEMLNLSINFLLVLDIKKFVCFLLLYHNLYSKPQTNIIKFFTFKCKIIIST